MLITVLAGLLGSDLTQAQQVQELNLNGVPPDLISPDAPPSAPLDAASSGAAGLAVQQTRQTPLVQQTDNIGSTRVTNVMPPVKPAVSLGEQPNQSNSAGVGSDGAAQAVDPPDAAAPGLAERAAQAAQAKRKPRLRSAVTDTAAGPPERAVFERAPVRVTLPIGHERLVTLPTAAALHVPADMDKVAHIENIDRTLYITAKMAFTPIRIVAELLDSGQQIPMDLVADKSTAAGTGELQVSVIDPYGQDGGPAENNSAHGPAMSAALAAQNAGSGTTTRGLDMVELTRYAARQLYAPARLAYRSPGVVQIQVAQVAQPTLIRGVTADIVPLGAWKSGPLYVTAIRVTNRSAYPLEIPLEQLRGNWIAATAQHGRIGPAGSDTDTTAIYLVSDRPFEACLL